MEGETENGEVKRCLILILFLSFRKNLLPIQGGCSNYNFAKIHKT